MEDYNKIIESLQIRFVKARNINILKPVTIENNYEVENYLILVKNGEIRFGKEKEQAKQGDVIFIPGGRPISISTKKVMQKLNSCLSAKFVLFIVLHVFIVSFPPNVPFHLSGR